MDKTFFSSNLNRNLATVSLALLVVALGAYAYLTLQQAKYLYGGPTTISVTGEGEINAVPDIGQFSFSIMAEGTDATTAQKDSGEKINTILAYLKEQGIEEKDIKTEYYNLSPKYRYEQKPCDVNRYCPGEQIMDGFEVSQSIRVKVRDLSKAGDLIAAVGDRGATNISSLSFTIDDTDVLKEQARAKAIDDAKTEAVVLARDLGVRLVRMVGYYADENVPIPYYGMGGDMTKAESASFNSPQIPAGENTTTSRVTITYEVR